MRLYLVAVVCLLLFGSSLITSDRANAKGEFRVFHEKKFTTEPKQLETSLVVFDIPFQVGTVGCELQFWRDGEIRQSHGIVEPRERFLDFVWRTPPSARRGKWQIKVVCSEVAGLWAGTVKFPLNVKGGTTEGYSIAKSIRARHLKLCTPKQQKKIEKKKPKGLYPCVMSS